MGWKFWYINLMNYCAVLEKNQKNQFWSLSRKAVIQTNNEPYVIFRYLLNIWLCLCSVSSSDFWNYEIRFVIINTILVWSSLMSLSEILSLGFNDNYIIIIELKLRSFQNLSGIIEKQSTSLYRKNQYLKGSCSIIDHSPQHVRCNRYWFHLLITC